MGTDGTISSVLEVEPQAESLPECARPELDVNIAEAARRTGVSGHALRYYERAGAKRAQERVVTPLGASKIGEVRLVAVGKLARCLRRRETGRRNDGGPRWSG